MEKNIRRFFFSVFVQDFFAIPLARLFIRFRVKANYVTLLGLLASIASGILYIDQSYILGAILFFFALILDSTDGRVARGTNTFSDFGARLDALTDKVRSFFVAFCFIWSLGYGLTISGLIFAFYILLPITRVLMSRKDADFYDPTILFWDATPLRDWFVKHKVWGLYNGWERSVLALTIAPLVVYKI
ncbi:CDP-alcohol phosphatidyltransferase family protein, partial [Colwellia sp. BRX8-8]|nr:CDP-alcohol phosphatidyltransferase family protein [Colwellia sp. BRX8-8]